MPVTVSMTWRGAFTDDELNALHAAAFGYPPEDHPWGSQVTRHSLGWVAARDEGTLIGFVNVLWDGRSHAVIVDTAVAGSHRRHGVGARLVAEARMQAAEAGCHWLHVDFQDRHRPFYLDVCGFFPTAAGVIDLRADRRS